jgi:predicted nucleic acid-binding protein
MTIQVVVDSSVAIKWFATEVQTPDALQFLAAWKGRQIECSVPDLVFAELANILWKKRRQGTMTEVEAAIHLQAFLVMPFDITPTRYLTEEALQIAMKYDRTAYDSTYLALAKRLNCPFVTADDRLVNAVAPHISNVIKLSNWKASPPTSASP